MISPLPFLGPVGAVPVLGMIGQLPSTRRCPTSRLQLDLIVVGTKEGLTMVEAGASEIPEDTLLEAFDLAHAEIKKLCELQEELRARAGKPKWLDPGSPTVPENSHGERIFARIHAEGLREAAAEVDAIVVDLPADLDRLDRRGHRPRDAGPRQPRGDPRAPAPRGRHGPGPRAVRGRLRALTDHEQDSKQLRSAKRHLLFERILETSDLPFPVGPATVEGEAPSSKDVLTRSYSEEGRRGDLQGPRSAARSPSRSAARTGGPPTRSGRSPASRGLARTHGSALFTRGQTQIMTLLTLGTAKEGQRIDDLSLEVERRFMHHYNFAPTRSGDGLHARPQAPRHRPRGARTARARAHDPGAGRVPVHDPPRLGDARVERIVLDGLSLRLDAFAHGRRRADQAAHQRHRHGPRQGG